MAKKNVSLKKFDSAVDKLKHLKPLIKPELLKACAITIKGDNKVTPSQLALYRAISSILDCPLPPLNNYTAAPLGESKQKCKQLIRLKQGYNRRT